VDAEQYATIHNLGFEAAMSQHCAPEGREADAQDWLEDKLDQAAADGIRDAITTYLTEFPGHFNNPILVWMGNRADLIHPATEQEPND
jgi:hypothetical protein